MPSFIPYYFCLKHLSVLLILTEVIVFGNVYVNIGYWMSHDPQPDKITSKSNLILLLILYRFGSGVIFHTQQPMLTYMLPIIMYYVLLIIYRFGLGVIFHTR